MIYNEQEIGAILKRTAELSHRMDQSTTEGLSLQEIQKLAAEAGLDPRLVALAAAEVVGKKAHSQKTDFFGGPLTYETDIDLDFDVDVDAWEAMLPAIREHFGDPGTVASREGVLEWTGTGGRATQKSHVSLRRIESGSRLHIYWSNEAMAVPFFIPTLLTLLISPVILFEELDLGLIGIPIYVLLAGLVFLLCRFGVTTLRGRTADKLDELGGTLSRIAAGNRKNEPEPHEVLAPIDRRSSDTTSTESLSATRELPIGDFDASESTDEAGIEAGPRQREHG